MKEPANKKLELTIPDAAQSVLRPLCLLSGLAAQFHVGQTGHSTLGQGSFVSNANEAHLWLRYRNFMALALALCGLGCEPRRHAGTDTTQPVSTVSSGMTSAVPPPVSAGSTMTPSKLHALPFAAAFGGVGPVTPPPYADAWVIVLVDVASRERLSGVEIKEIDLVDYGGKVVARAMPPWSLRRDSDATRAGRQRWDYSDSGTVPFDGEKPPGQDLRLRVNTPLDTRLQLVMSAQPVRFRARLLAAGDAGIWVEGPIAGGGPTAGPARSP